MTLKMSRAIFAHSFLIGKNRAGTALLSEVVNAEGSVLRQADIVLACSQEDMEGVLWIWELDFLVSSGLFQMVLWPQV